MSYNIEVSFNLIKRKDINEVEELIISIAKDYKCSFCYSNMEMDNNGYIQRNHNVITSIFKEENIKDLVEYIKILKKMKGIYIECIFNEQTNQIIYASPYYLTIMDKILSNHYKLNKRKRSYSEDETWIRQEINKN